MTDVNTSKNKVVPQEIKRWNWGAFMMNIIWGFGNKSYLPLLCFIPVFGIIWLFVCGVKGNEWAWKKGDYDSVASFMKVQETWNRAGVVYFIITIIFAIIFILFSSIILGLLFSAMTSFDSSHRMMY
ncbi:ribonuclease G [Morganella morganii]|nr:ribonuclease G [Morganella morganii]